MLTKKTQTLNQLKKFVSPNLKEEAPVKALFETKMEKDCSYGMFSDLVGSLPFRHFFQFCIEVSHLKDFFRFAGKSPIGPLGHLIYEKTKKKGIMCKICSKMLIL